MNQSMNQIPKSGAIPMQVDVKIHTLHTSGSVLASASVNLNGCFAIRGVKVVDSPKGEYRKGTGIPRKQQAVRPQAAQGRGKGRAKVILTVVYHRQPNMERGLILCRQ